MSKLPLHEQNYKKVCMRFCQNIEGDVYRVNGNEYLFTEDGRVYCENDEYSYSEVKDPEITEHVKLQAEFDRTIENARSELTVKLADGVEKLSGILRIHLEYTGGKIYPHEREGITFYQVGRNASHEFYLGVKDGKIFKRSVGECSAGEEIELDQYDTPELEEHIYEIKEGGSIGYLGHF